MHTQRLAFGSRSDVFTFSAFACSLLGRDIWHHQKRHAWSHLGGEISRHQLFQKDLERRCFFFHGWEIQPSFLSFVVFITLANFLMGRPAVIKARKATRCAPVWTSRGGVSSNKPVDFGVIFLCCRVSAVYSCATICFGNATLHSLISCCTNDGEQLENSVHCSVSVMDHILPYYLVLPAMSGLGRQFFWFSGIFWVKGFWPWGLMFDVCFLLLALGWG